MTALLLKDFKVGALFLWPVGLIYLLMTVQFAVFGYDAPVFLASIALAASIVATVLIVEWRVDADRFLCSLPVSRSTVVGGRCLSILAAGALSLALWVSGGLAAEVLMGHAGRGTPLWASFGGVVSFCLIIAGLAALFMPCYFRFGAGKGSVVFSFLLIPLVAAETAGSLVVRREVAGGPALGAAVSAAPGGLVRHSVVAAQQGLGAVGALAVFALAGAALLWVSVALSIRFYEKREF